MARNLILFFLCISVAAAAGCGKEARNDQGNVLAQVGDEVITVGDFEEKIARLPENLRPLAENNKEAFLDNLVAEILLYNEAVKKGVANNKETRELLAEAERKIMMARFVQEEVEDRINVSENDMKSYYDERKADFTSPETYRASHILVRSMEEAVSIADKLNAGALFEELAKTHSMDVTNTRGGDVGYFSTGQMVPEFEDACARLNVGEISGPVKTQFGFHIVKLTDKKAPEPIEYDKVKQRIDMMIRTEKRRELLEQLLTKLKSNKNIVLNTELLETGAQDRQQVEVSSDGQSGRVVIKPELKSASTQEQTRTE